MSLSYAPSNSAAQPLKTRQGLAILTALLLTPCMVAVFRAFHGWFGMPLGYLLSMVIYWTLWCTIIPLFLLGGWRSYLALFRPMPGIRTLGLGTHLLLWGPVVFPLVFKFLPSIAGTTPAIIAASVVLAALVGISEEVLWRGVFIRLFPTSRWMNLILPSILFAVWHVAPLAVMPNRLPGGVYSFVFYALILGLFYGLAARRTGSIAWPTVAHILHDSLGLSGYILAAWLLP